LPALATLVGFAAGVLIALIAGLFWKLRYTRAIRRDAVERSAAVTAGKVHEQLVPHLAGFEFNPKDARFLGSPVDFVVFDGMAAGDVSRIVFLEVKTGAATLSPRERQVKEAVLAGRIEWREWRVGPRAVPPLSRER
jgi:predicted Holliday junction resolvase-like endonuclease